jgi:plastocyanin
MVFFLFQNYTVHVTDKGFVPKVLSVSTDDRVWWVWQGTTKPHNIIQVNNPCIKLL